MRQHPLIRHPVGKLPISSRWYLATMAILLLILIAVHFAIQVVAQQEAKSLVSAWVKETGMVVGDVQYRMLRGALTLVDVRLHHELYEASAPLVFLQGNLNALGGDQPEAAYIELRGSRVSLQASAFHKQQNDSTELVPEMVAQLWNSAHRIKLLQSTVNIIADNNAILPRQETQMHLIQLESALSTHQRVIRARAGWLAGKVTLMLQLPVGEQSQAPQGEMTWSGLNAPALFHQVLGLEPVPGTLNGHMSWVGNTDQNIQDSRGGYDITGSTRIVGPGRSGNASELNWKGIYQHGNWHGELAARAWPLRMFASYAPGFQGYQLKAGSFDGAMTLQGGLHHWQAKFAASELKNIRMIKMANNPAEARPGEFQWKASSLHVEQAQLLWPERQLSLTGAVVKHAEIVVDTMAAKQASQGWKISAPDIELQSLAAAVQLPQGRFMLPEMGGSVSWQQGGRLDLSLQSTGTNAEGEFWRVVGTGNPCSAQSGANYSDAFNMDVETSKAPLARFRVLLPELLRKEARDLDGMVALKLDLVAGLQPWQGTGQVRISDAGMLIGGELWHAETMDIDLEAVGPALAMQKVRHLDVHNWHYQAALRPLKQTAVEVTMPDAAGRPPAWHIQEFNAVEGTVAVGQADAVWAQHIGIKAKELHSETLAAFEIKADMGEGEMAMHGKLEWRSALPAIHEAKIRIRDVLPFFLNQWLQVSGAPGFDRGRLYADVSVRKDDEETIKGKGFFRLQHGALQTGHGEQDPLLLRIGYHAQDVMSALHESGRVRLSAPIDGKGTLFDVLGEAWLKAVGAAMKKKGASVRGKEQTPGEHLASLRLHEGGGLSHNERSRLRVVVRYLIKHANINIELRPSLSLSSDIESQLERIRYTQSLIQDFLLARGISISRIFPVWPTEQHQSAASSNGIGILTLN